MSLRATALTALIAAALLVGCGDDPDAGGSDGQATATTASVPANFDITGSWSGELTQKGLAPFTLTATINTLSDSTTRGRNPVHYTGIDCDGNWTYLGNDGAAFRFREVIHSGEGGNCKGVGVVSLTPTGPQAVDYEFEGGGIESTGILKRVIGVGGAP